ncbi:MAG: VWA domain-containing protein [Planctomycetota bacterium]
MIAELFALVPSLQETQAGGTPQPLQTEETFRFLALPPAWVLGLVVLPAIVLFARWSYGGLARLEPSTRALLATLRGLAILFCVFLLLQPAFERVRYSQIKGQVHVLVDDSASMQRKDSYPEEAEASALSAASGIHDLATATRSQLVRAVLEKPGGPLDELRKAYDVRLFRFVRKPLPVRDLGELTSGGNRTWIGDALDLHLATLGAANGDSVIVVSDGRNNAGADPLEAAQKYRLNDAAIYTVGVGDANPPKNVRMIGPPGPQEALLGEDVTFECVLDPESLAGRLATVTLEASLDGGPFRALASERATLGEDHVPVPVRLNHKFDAEGDWTLKFRVVPLPEETSVDDNEAIRFLHVEDRKIRVLYVEDVPRWEYRYVKNALKRVDDAVVVQCFLADATRSFEQEHSEVLPPLKAIPSTREELRQYDVILLGDLPPERLAPTEEGVQAWLDALLGFVEDGGGVGFIWGERAMPERYRGTPLQDLLPVVLEDPADAHPVLGRFRPALENPTQPHEIVRLKRETENNRALWERGFTPLEIYYPVQQAKAGAQVLLVHPTDRNRYGNRVIAATAPFPRGNTFFIATDETWRWRMIYGEKYHDVFWRSVVRSLAAGRLARRDVRYVMTLDRASIDTGGQVTVDVIAQDQEFQPLLAEQLAIFLRREQGGVERKLLRPTAAEPGTYTGRFTLDQPGSYSFLVLEGDREGGKILARQDVLVQIPDRELADSSQDRTGLEAMARQSKGGRYVPLADAARLCRDLAERRPASLEVDRSTRPVWDSTWSLLGLLALLATEWLLRKRSRLI